MTKPALAIIAALSHNHVIGKDNQLLWHLPVDQAFFKQMTLDHAIIMGSKTYWSLPEKFRPLPKRLNVIISRTSHPSTENAAWVTSPEMAHAKAELYAQEREQEFVFIGGGGEIYQYYLPHVTRMYLTHVAADYEGNAFFPQHYLTMKWKRTILAEHPATETQPAFQIVQYDRI